MINIEQEDFGFDYTPSVMGSRSSKMQKITRKGQKKKYPEPTNIKKNDDFDVLEDLLYSEEQKSQKIVKPMPEPKKNVIDQTDEFFKEPPLTSTNINVTINNPPKKKQPSILHNTGEIIEEPTISSKPSFKFRRPNTTENAIKREDTSLKKDEEEITVSPSVRKMNGPLRKKQKTSVSDSLGLTLPPDSSITLKGEQKKVEEEPRKVRPSIQLKNEEVQDKFKSFKKQQTNIKTEVPSKSMNQVKSNLNPPPILTLENNSSSVPKKKQYPIPFKAEETINYGNINYDNVASGISNPGNMDKQMEFMRKNYENHIQSLQNNLQEQIKANKSARNQLMNESNFMIENERKRMQQIHDEQMSRVKQMSEWEKKKIADQYKSEVQSLKRQLHDASKLKDNKFIGYSSLQMQKKQVGYYEDKLKNQKKLLEERQKIVEKRQRECQERERDFTRRRKIEEDKLKQYEKKLMTKQAEWKKQQMDTRHDIQMEKQAMALQLTKLELESHGKSEKLHQYRKELEIQREQLEKQKREMRSLMNQFMGNFKQKDGRLDIERKKVLQMEQELRKKLKVVERMKDSVGDKVTQKQNNWVSGNLWQAKQSQQRPRQRTQQQKIEETKDRFHQVSSTIREKSLEHKQKKRFDIDGYLMNMSKYTRKREYV